MVNVASLATRFAEVFPGCTPIVRARAPGRVCLLGEHTDYNEGLVMPVAIEPAVHTLAGRRSAPELTVRSVLMEETVTVPLDGLLGSRTRETPFVPAWCNYVFGVAVLLARRGFRLPGANLLIDSDLPAGGGVSSSAALEVSVAQTLLDLMDQTLPKVELALLARQAEHEFAGSPCGILDQFASVLSRERHALRLDCRSREFEHIAFGFETCVIAVLDTRTRHELARSEYPLRQAQCRDAVAALQCGDPPVRSLRDVTVEQLLEHSDEMEPVVFRRAHHVVTENKRVEAGVDALRHRDVRRYGQLMTTSHESLRHQFEVSCPELDKLVEVALGVQGVYGAKMSGGGFGGCVVALLEADAELPLREAIREHYDGRFAQPAGVTISLPAAGAEASKL